MKNVTLRNIKYADSLNNKLENSLQCNYDKMDETRTDILELYGIMVSAKQKYIRLEVDQCNGEMIYMR